jgi:hypothetical protein
MYKFLFLRNTKILIFGEISKFVFGQFWVEFAALAMANIKPKDHLKS